MMEDLTTDCGIDEPTEPHHDNFNADIARRIQTQQHPITLRDLTILYLVALRAKHPKNKSAAARTAGKTRWALQRLLNKFRDDLTEQ